MTDATAAKLKNALFDPINRFVIKNRNIIKRPVMSISESLSNSGELLKQVAKETFSPEEQRSIEMPLLKTYREEKIENGQKTLAIKTNIRDVLNDLLARKEF